MTRPDTIAAALAKIAAAIDQVADERWSFALANGTTTTGSARIDGPWLALDAPLDVGAADPATSPQAMLAWNATLEGGARLALPPGRSDLHVRADVALDPDVDVGRRIIEACAGFKTALRYRHGEGNVAVLGTPPATVADGADDLLMLCRATGWSVKERGPGDLAVDLDVPGTLQQAAVLRQADGTVAASVPVVEAVAGASASVNRRALALLLVRMSGIVRLARASAAADHATPPRFEVVYARPSVAELTHGFAALSVACRLASAEAAVLQHDDVVAATYVQQWEGAVARRAA